MRKLTAFVLASLVTGSAFAQSAPTVKNWGQELVDQVLLKNPGVLVVVMHVATPTMPNYPIVASNIGRYGKPADADDMRVVTTEKPNLEVGHDGKRFEVELVMRDVVGKNIGALGVVFPYRAGTDKKALEQRATAIRDWIGRRVLTAASLVDPYPTDPSATTKTRAQKIVDELYEKNRDLNALALHVTPPKSADNIIIASTFGRIGKKADDDDKEVIEKGVTKSGVYGGGLRFGVELPLLDVAGNTVGALSVGYPFKDGDDQQALLRKAEAIRDLLRKRIASLEELNELDP